MALISNGSTIFDAGAMAAGFGGSMTFIKKLTANNSANLTFVGGASGVVLDNSFKEYMFTFNNMHPQNDQIDFLFDFSVDGGSNYGVTKTSSCIIAYNAEGGAGQGLQYNSNQDLAQGTDFDFVVSDVGNEADEAASGSMTLFNPSSTTFVKNYLIRAHIGNGFYSQDELKAGYGNTTSAINAVQFKFLSGNIDSGQICLYGIA